MTTTYHADTYTLVGRRGPMGQPSWSDPADPLRGLGSVVAAAGPGVHRAEPPPSPAPPPPPTPPAAPGSSWGSGSGSGGSDPAVGIRHQVVDRLVSMSARQAEHAWRRRRDRPVGPHAVAFLYLDRTGETDLFHVKAATRMVDDGPDVRDLPGLLDRLATLARDRYASTPGGFDPKVHMTNRHDRASGQAQYIGVGVSTLDTPTGSWEQVQGTARDAADVPGRCYVILSDGTVMLIDRQPQRSGFGAVHVHSTHSLGPPSGLPSRSWALYEYVVQMRAPMPVWDRLYELHMVTYRQPVRPML